MIVKKKTFSLIFWAILIVLSAYYFYSAIEYRFFEEGIGPTFWNKQFWFVSHILAGILPLVTGPFQFWSWFRKHHIKWHRLLGKLYIIGCLFGGFSALYLGITQPYDGSIVPTLFLATLWLFMTISAWITIKRKQVEAHRLFMIRSYTLTLAFVFLRLLYDLVYKLNFLSFIANEEVRDATYEWISWVAPVLIVEFFISWLPLVKSDGRRKKVRTE
ncbi:DUF2306 domain-containing protein [Flavobacterium capsici]|uniref:DUF2306 domain-containing protein n=1 Tax=Flavobacterium capsici TaxID=3075618 RepID=A0AA96EY43_9FLAO|nr:MULTISPECIES: DUF2306 domain-containing protein [unclassified Flavobacterium]WNM20361.1 DUF2306 domain-containing protein [Flavobacterium sp. PMR2A8]WNM21751.1 DUF2306 domain-containing protein [Flavobacterium sp. PMTSA4]